MQRRSQDTLIQMSSQVPSTHPPRAWQSPPPAAHADTVIYIGVWGHTLYSEDKYVVVCWEPDDAYRSMRTHHCIMRKRRTTYIVVWGQIYRDIAVDIAVCWEANGGGSFGAGVAGTLLLWGHIRSSMSAYQNTHIAVCLPVDGGGSSGLTLLI